MRIDIVIIILGLLLVVAMALTLLYGKENSRHGYGATEAYFQQRALSALPLPPRLSSGATL